jgi:ribosome-associated protein
VITVTRNIRIPDGEIRFTFIRSAGPGGQNVNKLSTAVQLRFDVEGSPSLPERVKRRLALFAGSRLTSGGELLIEARRFRTRERNRRDALDRLTALIRKAAHRPKTRRPTKPSKAAKRARLESKLRRGKTKELRRRPNDHH